MRRIVGRLGENGFACPTWMGGRFTLNLRLAETLARAACAAIPRYGVTNGQGTEACCKFCARNDSSGSWLCENSSARRACRNISKKLRTMESNRSPRTMFDNLLENCIFHISQLYEFSHRLGHQRPRGSKPHAYTSASPRKRL